MSRFRGKAREASKTPSVPILWSNGVCSYIQVRILLEIVSVLGGRLGDTECRFYQEKITAGNSVTVLGGHQFVATC